VSSKTAIVTGDGDGLRFKVRTGSGHELVVDNAEGNAGPRPAELVVVAHAGCTAMDVLSILRKKRQVVTRYEVEVAAEQADVAPHVFVRSDVTHVVEGPAVDEAAVRRAIELSALKYCSVGATLSAGPVEVHHRYRIIGPTGSASIEGEVLVTGPNADLGAVGGSGE
jgi:putative redox protein